MKHLLENIATSEAKFNGLDIADYMITQLHSQTVQEIPKIQSYFTPALQNMIDQNANLLILINKLQLFEVNSSS